MSTRRRPDTRAAIRRIASRSRKRTAPPGDPGCEADSGETEAATKERRLEFLFDARSAAKPEQQSEEYLPEPRSVTAERHAADGNVASRRLRPPRTAPVPADAATGACPPPAPQEIAVQKAQVYEAPVIMTDAPWQAPPGAKHRGDRNETPYYDPPPAALVQRFVERGSVFSRAAMARALALPIMALLATLRMSETVKRRLGYSRIRNT
ncbi:hypothetical protein ACFL59_14915 [Planctomycetota bacterium]